MKNECHDNTCERVRPLITILGPTASGKTDLAAHLAYQLDAEIISPEYLRNRFRNAHIKALEMYQ